MYIKKGWGFHVGQNFTRATYDIPIIIDANGYAKPGHVIGEISGDPDSPLGFMRNRLVRVHIQKRALTD